MKSDIKKLYKKDKKLAIQVAKALGMKIIAQDETKDLEYKEVPVDIQKTLKVIGLTPNKFSQIVYYDGEIQISIKKNILTTLSRNELKYLMKNSDFVDLVGSKNGLVLNFLGKNVKDQDDWV